MKKKQASLHDVAEAANVSVGTVSNYLNRTAKVSSKTQKRIQKAIEDLGYRRNEVARSLRRARTKTFGVIVPNVANPFYTVLFDGVEQAAQQQGYTVTLGITHYQNTLLEQYIDTLYSRRVDGLIINAYGSYCAEDVFKDIEIPIVVIEPPANFRLWSTIQIDNTVAARQLIAYLLEQGHRRIAIITQSRDLRFAGYEQALERHGIDVDPELIYEFGQFESDAIAQGEHILRMLRARTSFTACFVIADSIAIGVLKAAKEDGLDVPHDLAIAGFDDIPFAALTDPPLTTVAQSQHKMGQIAVEVLLRRIRNKQQTEPEHIVVDHQLVIRGSA